MKQVGMGNVSGRMTKIVFAATLIFAGCGDPWVVVRQASPNPFIHHAAFGVEPMHYEGLTVGGDSEAAYLADKDAQARAGWEQDKAAIDTSLRAGIQEELRGHPLVAPGQDPFTLRPQVTFIEPGIYSGVFNKASRVELTLFIVDSHSGAVLDEIQFEASENATLTSPSIGQRLRGCGRHIGRLIAEYVARRTGVE